MKRFTDVFSRSVGLIMLALVALTACDRAPETPPPPPTVYSVKLYADDVEPLRTYSTTRVSTGEGIAWVLEEGKTEYTRIAGTFVVEPQGALSAAERAHDSKYKVTLYVGSKVLRTWYVAGVSTGENIAWIRADDKSEWTRINGTFIVEPL